MAIFYFYFLWIISILTHTKGERGESFKETNSDVYPKGSNSWIQSTYFSSLKVVYKFTFSKSCEFKKSKSLKVIIYDS